MTIADFLSDINNVDSIGVPTQRASTPEELYQNCIALALKEEKEITDAIIEWHKLLMRYINNVKNGAVLLSRLYESLKVDDQWANRRGCLTLAKNYNYAFASNHFARVIFTMAINKFVPTDEDFWDMIVNRKISLSSYLGQTQQAKRISAYPNKSYNIKYYTPGWYLAHVIPVNNHAYQGYENINVYDIYKHGEESEWQYDCALNCMVRKTDDCIDSDKMKVAKAHFLRFLDPINYFLVPGQRHVIYKQIKKGDGWPIGENKYIVDLMTIKAHDRFGKYFEEFLKVALVEDDYIEKVRNRYKPNEKIDATYSTIPFANNKQKTAICSEEKALEIAAFYLRNKKSMIYIEETFLNLKNRKGYTAMAILNALGITGKEKGLLINSDVDTEISSVSGVLKDTLTKIKVKCL